MTTPFVGRAGELAVLTADLDTAVAGRGGVVLLAGEPGIGKTRLAEELAAQATGRGALVLWGRCWEGEGAPAFWPWVQAVRAYVQTSDPAALRHDLGAGAADMAQVVPAIRDRLPDLPPPPAVEPEAARFRLFDSLAAFLRAAAARRPLLLILDDLHWADAPSLALLRFVSRELEHGGRASLSNPVGWILCALGLVGGIRLFGAEYAVEALLVTPGSLPFGEALAWISTWIWVPYIGLLVFMALLFPNGRLASGRMRWVAWLTGGVIATGVALAAFAPGPVFGLASVRNPLGIDGMSNLDQLVEALIYTFGIAASASLLVRLRKARGTERQQIKWFVYATASLWLRPSAEQPRSGTPTGTS